jgi:hypothetical protein
VDESDVIDRIGVREIRLVDVREEALPRLLR